MTIGHGTLVEKYLALCEEAHRERAGRNHFCYMAIDGRMVIVADDTPGPYPLSEDLFLGATDDDAERLNDERLRISPRDAMKIIASSMTLARSRRH